MLYVLLLIAGMSSFLDTSGGPMGGVHPAVASTPVPIGDSSGGPMAGVRPPLAATAPTPPPSSDTSGGPM